jgi:hypothetical protein
MTPLPTEDKTPPVTKMYFFINNIHNYKSKINIILKNNSKI